LNTLSIITPIYYKKVKKVNLFSKKVFALTMFLPIAEAFQAKYDPDGST